MSSKTKIALASVLIVVCAGVWVPQVLDLGGDSEAVVIPAVSADGTPMTPVPAEGGEAATVNEEASGGEVLIPVEPGMEGEPREGEPTGSPPVESSDDDPLVVLSSLEGTLDVIETFVPSPRDRIDLASLLASSGNRIGQTGSTTDPDSSTVEEIIGAALQPGPQEVLRQYAEANPLTGIIYGDDRSMALIGHRVVGEGDSLEGGRIRVLAIGPGWLRLGYQGEELVMDLPPFVAATARSTDDDSESSESGDEEEDTDGGGGVEGVSGGGE